MGWTSRGSTPPAFAAALPAAVSDAAPRPPAGAGEIGNLFAQLEVRPGKDGRVVFEAPAEVAASLAALFSGMAQMLAARQVGPGFPRPLRWRRGGAKYMDRS